MVQTDTIGDLIVRIGNAAKSGKAEVIFPHSKMMLAIAGALERAGYIEVLPRKGKKAHWHIEAKIKYEKDSPKFNGAVRISKPSKRIFWKIKNVAPVKNGHGSLILSTPKGIMTDKEAKKENVGGEALFQIW